MFDAGIACCKQAGPKLFYAALMAAAKRSPVLWICIAVLLARLFILFQVYAIDPQRVLNSDSPSYQGPARALVKLGRFSQSPEAPDLPEIERTPGYPLFIAFSYKLAGEDDRMMLVLQIITSVLTVALAAAIAGELWGKKAAMPAALLLALDPISFLYSLLVFAEDLFALILTFHVWIVLRLLGEKRQPWLWALASGLTLAAATHVRPIAYYFILPLLLTIVWAFRREPMSWTRSLLIALVVFAAWAPAVLGWQVRNYRLTGMSDFSSIQAINLFLYRGAGIVAQQDGTTLEAAQDKLLAEAPAAAKASDATWYAYCKREGLRLMREHPLLMFEVQVKGAGRMLFGPGVASFDKYFGSVGRYVTSYSVIYLIGIYGLVIICLINLFRQRPLILGQHLFLGVVVIYLVCISAGPEANSRFRSPVMPILAAFAAGGVRRRAWQEDKTSRQPAKD